MQPFRKWQPYIFCVSTSDELTFNMASALGLTIINMGFHKTVLITTTLLSTPFTASVTFYHNPHHHCHFLSKLSSPLLLNTTFFTTSVPFIWVQYVNISIILRVVYNLVCRSRENYIAKHWKNCPVLNTQQILTIN